MKHVPSRAETGDDVDDGGGLVDTDEFEIVVLAAERSQDFALEPEDRGLDGGVESVVLEDSAFSEDLGGEGRTIASVWILLVHEFDHSELALAQDFVDGVLVQEGLSVPVNARQDVWFGREASHFVCVSIWISVLY